MTTTRRLTLVWAVLLALTFGSFIVGIEQSADLAGAAAIAIIGIALFKVRLIGLHFMDVRIAPTALRVLFEGYVLVVFTALVILDLVVRP
ncbi:cytochrome C oxidase subunit IV family protein [Mycolicibacterium psychrotolerans]|uniref:cytochrome C oxidase subunit IV family protein n=1 Tax=Mycolicibacterium psychrotolerans TaxID=216929 RepID=UPI003D672BF2